MTDVLKDCPTLIRERKLCVGCGCRDCLGQVKIYDAIAAEVGKVIERAEQYENVLHDARNEIIFLREWAICKRELIYGDVTWTKAQECVEAITNALGQNPLLPNYRRESEAENE